MAGVLLDLSKVNPVYLGAEPPFIAEAGTFSSLKFKSELAKKVKIFSDRKFNQLVEINIEDDFAKRLCIRTLGPVIVKLSELDFFQIIGSEEIYNPHLVKFISAETSMSIALKNNELLFTRLVKINEMKSLTLECFHLLHDEFSLSGSPDSDDSKFLVKKESTDLYNQYEVMAMADDDDDDYEKSIVTYHIPCVLNGKNCYLKFVTYRFYFSDEWTNHSNYTPVENKPLTICSLKDNEEILDVSDFFRFKRGHVNSINLDKI